MMNEWLMLHPQASVEDVNEALLHATRTVFPGRIQHGRIVPWQEPQAALSVRAMWQAYRVWRGTTTGRPRTLWQAWAAYALFQKAHKAFRRSARQAKVNWLHTQVQTMELEARKGNTRALFQLAGRLGPKAPKRSLQLRGPEGLREKFGHTTNRSLASKTSTLTCTRPR